MAAHGIQWRLILVRNVADDALVPIAFRRTETDQFSITESSTLLLYI